jgi:3-methylcrotonyl-CoA carboxylase alpha subunit
MRQRPPSVGNPWQSGAMTGWHMGSGGADLSPIALLHLEAVGASAEIRFSPVRVDGTMLIAVGDETMTVSLQPMSDGSHLAIVDGRQSRVRVLQDGGTLYVHDRDGTHTLKAIPYLTYISASAESSGEMRAPMMGMITRVNVAPGQPIKIGEVAVVMESMKMELRIASKVDGVVASVNCKAGDMIERNAVVAVVDRHQQAGG